MIKREKDYLAKKKKKFLRGSIIWSLIVFGIFITGYGLNNTRSNIFTVVAAVLVLPIAQNLTQLLTLWKFKDPNLERSNELEGIKGNYSLFHSVLVPDIKEIMYFDHILVTGTKIYCIINRHANLPKIKSMFNKKIKAKGIPLSAVVYVDLSQTKDMGNLFKTLETNAAIQNQENLNEFTHLIAQMMM